MTSNTNLKHSILRTFAIVMLLFFILATLTFNNKVPNLSNRAVEHGVF